MTTISKRQREILHWFAEGYSMQQICLLMGISYNVINKHTASIRQRWQAENNTKAVAIAFQMGIIW